MHASPARDDPQPKTPGDFRVGDRIITRRRTIGIGDINTFAGLTGNYNPLHVDRAFMASSRFGRRLCHGSLTYSVAAGLIERSGAFGNCLIGLAHLETMRAAAPVHSGDSILVMGEVIRIIPAKPDLPVELTLACSIGNQDGVVVMTFVQTVLLKPSVGEPLVAQAVAARRLHKTS